MRELKPGQAAPVGRSLEGSRGGWAFFGRLLVWATRNNCRAA